MESIQTPKLLCKFIGHQNDSNCDFVLELNKDGITNLKYIYLKFMEKGISIQDLKKIKFISSGTNIKDLDMELLNSKEKENKKIYIFNNDYKIKEDLVKKIFTNIPLSSIQPPKYSFSNQINNSPVSKDLENLPLEDDEEEIYNPTNEDIIKINEKITRNFQNKDFVDLLRLCINKPELLKMVNGYFVNGDVIGNLDNINISYKEFKFENEFNYIKSFVSDKLLLKLDDNFEKKTKDVIQYFNGHLNLSLRYILSKYLEESNIKTI